MSRITTINIQEVSYSMDWRSNIPVLPVLCLVVFVWLPEAAGYNVEVKKVGRASGVRGSQFGYSVGIVTPGGSKWNGETV